MRESLSISSRIDFLDGIDRRSARGAFDVRYEEMSRFFILAAERVTFQERGSSIKKNTFHARRVLGGADVGDGPMARNLHCSHGRSIFGG